MRQDYNNLIKMDWVSVHYYLDRLRYTNFRRYWALLDWLAPDQAKEGRWTSQKPPLGETIALGYVPKIKRANMKNGVQKKVCKKPSGA